MYRPKRLRRELDGLTTANGSMTSLVVGGQTLQVGAVSSSDLNLKADQADLTSLQGTVNTNSANITSNANTLANKSSVTSIQQSGGKVTGLTIDGTAFELSAVTPDATTTDAQVTLAGDWSISGGATSEFPSGGEGRLVDGTTDGTDYVLIGANPPSPSAPFILTYDHGSAVQINKYKVFRHTSKYPQSWTFEASANNADWTLLDSTYQVVDSLGSVTSNVSDDASFNGLDTAYRYYRFNFTSTDDDTANYELKVREIQFFTVSRELDNLNINDTIFPIGSGGTTVVANPSTSPTSNLTKLTVGGTDYNVGSNVAFRVYKSSSTTVSYPTNVNGTDIDFDNVLFDTNNGWSNTNHDYTVPIAGIYQVGFHGGTPDSATSGAKVRIMHYDGSTWNITAEFGSDAGMANAGITLIQASVNDKFKVIVRESIIFNVYNTTLLSMFGHRIM